MPAHLPESNLNPVGWEHLPPHSDLDRHRVIVPSSPQASGTLSGTVRTLLFRRRGATQKENLMFRMKVIGLAVGLVLVAITTTLTASGVFAQGPTDRPFSATMEGSVLPDGSGAFDMVATHLGNSSGVGEFIVTPNAAGCFDFVAGGFTWTAANGDQVNTTVTDEDFYACIIGGDFTTYLLIELSATEVIDGGTGRFENVTGKVTVEILQTLDLTTGASTFTGTKTGVIGY